MQNDQGSCKPYSTPKSKASVMIIDDQAAILKEIESLVNKSGIAKVIASETDGEAAIEKALQIRPDIVLLDVSMPVLSGIAVAQRLKACWNSVTIIAISAHDNEIYIRSMLEAGASGYILKDHVSKEINQAIPSVLNGERWLSNNLRQPESKFN